MDKKMFFLDLDFTTLKDDKSIPEVNIDAIRETLDAGQYVAIDTGRSPIIAKPIAESLGMNRKGCYLICFNGAMIFDLSDGSLLRDLRMPDEYAAYLFSEAERAGIYMQAYEEDGKVISSRACPEADYYSSKVKTPYTVNPDLYHLKTYHTPKVLSISLDGQQPLLDFRQDHLDWEAGKCISYFSFPEMLEYSYIEATKESGMLFFEDYLGIPHENTIAIGDAGNDLPMITGSGIGCAMSNAIDEVKEQADYITELDNNSGGVAEVLRKFR